MGKPLHWIVILQLVSSALAYGYDWYRADTQRPVDVITDVVNDLGVKILQQYSAHGNVAFSPTGVAFVLAALYEGSAGRGKQQIAEAMGLPNWDVTRIGFRDIHRRLRSYLNADGFLGGLTLSKENTRLRPEYEDILRFYGFDLSSIEQANVTVSTGDSSSTTELPTSTIGTTALPIAPDTTTTLTDNITTLPSAGIETTVTSSIQQTATSADMRTTSMPVTGSETDGRNTLPTQPTNSLTTVTSGESARPSPAAGPESVAGSPNTVTPAVNAGLAPATVTGSQTSPSAITTVVAAGDRAPPQTPPTVAVGTGGTGTSETVANAVVPNANATAENLGNTNLSAPAIPGASTAGAGVTTAITADASATMGAEMSSTFATNTELPLTTAAGSNLSITPAADMSTEVLAAASTIIASVIPADASAASNSRTPAAPTTSNNATVTNPGPVTMTNNSVVSQSNTEISVSVDTPAGNIPGMTAMNDLTATPVINADGNVAGNSDNSTIASSAMNSTINNQVRNSTISSMMSNQTVVSPLDENTVLTNRKKKAAGDEAVELELNRKSLYISESPSLRKRRSPRGYFSSYPDEGIWMQDLEIWKSYNTVNPSESSDGDSAAEISFLVNGCDVSSVSASSYIAVLPFAYLPSLHAVALEFPLDDPRYNIILLMPTDKSDTHRLARDLSGKSLRSLRKRLQPTWVRATIPSFMLRGFVTLTSFLQRLGILDVFEPRVADLSPMTSDLGVYARDVQQSIGVNIRNYMKPDRTHSRESSNVVPPRRDYYRYLPPGNGLFERAGPVPFTALHPFLYFIVDTETSVSLIAGRVDDPLNSRIL